MSLTLVVFAGFYPAARHTVQYANTLTQALRGKLVLLHVNRASTFDCYATLPEHYHQEELARQTETAAALYRLAEELATRPTVEVATDFLPEIAQDQASRHRPALFVLSQPYQPHENAASLATGCADLLRGGHHPLLVVPTAASAEQAPRRILIAADREAFTLAPAALALHPLFALPGVELVVAHVSDSEDDAGCGAALRAVQLSGLVKGVATPELRGYEHDNYAEGLLAAVADTGADLVVVLARQRSYLGELFHRSVTAQLLERCPVPVLVLPVAAAVEPVA
jgi:nucleotide-binding universal stress UspA family protein